ncbi:MAG: hypothetical protein IKD88_08410 [Lachnospiraceae bacterium]|nr:hypothetical protein [Lachnospiraceae bacterium]
MKYGETAFDIFYLAFAIISAVVILRRARGREDKLCLRMGLATLILGCGDAFHLIPRVIDHFSDADMTAALGAGKLITSLTMTVFYLLLYYVWRELRGMTVDHGPIDWSNRKERPRLTYVVTVLAVLRFVLCLRRENGWLDDSGTFAWAVIRNVPFVALGLIVCVLYFGLRKTEDGRTPDAGPAYAFRRVWLLILLSFLFYIPVAVGADFVPMLGMLMLPKTVCYILMIRAFLLASRSAPA